MRKLVIGILAHVDAGKTTLAEGILYKTGSIRKAGRVDHKNTFLDTNELERERGITIFSKQAVFTYKDMYVTLLDTPGHVDFSAEMERTLQVLDYAILVINGSDGVQGHTETLWRLLTRYKIPTFIFVNKMDIDGTDRKTILNNLKKYLNEGCVDFSDEMSSKAFQENLAMCDERLLNKYLENGVLETKDIVNLVSKRKVYPCYFGSALKLDGVDSFLNGLLQFTIPIRYPDGFGAKVFKINRDEQGNRLTYLKITGGSIKVKDLLTNRRDNATTEAKHYYKDNKTTPDEQIIQPYHSISHNKDTLIWEDKIDQIRVYSGVRYETVDEVEAGMVCAVTGLTETYPGEGLGIEAGSAMPIIEPVLNYQIILPQELSPHIMLSKLRLLEEEDPQLHIIWNEQLKEIHVQLMGEIQLEILKNIILERFGVQVEFGQGNIVYKETILEPVVGVGHYEPLRHYAEVHLLLEPGEPGSGLIFSSNCSEDVLDRNWQRAVLTHLEEKEHIGVLIGAPITDMKITLIAGRAHQKHTDGGDFRQATYRAVRQGLKKAISVLLEPYYSYRLEIPSDTVGRAMTDINRMNGNFNPPELNDGMSVLTGSAPVAAMRDYQMEVIAYTRGRGRLFCTLSGYKPCLNADEIIKAYNYDSESDIDNPTSSVFCSHGAGFVVEWDKVEDYKHVESEWQQSIKDTTVNETYEVKVPKYISKSLHEDKELEDIFVRTFGPIKDRRSFTQNERSQIRKSDSDMAQHKHETDIKNTNSGNTNQHNNIKKSEQIKEYLLVDGYNIIFSWDELNELAKVNMDAARNKLMDILCNYQGFKKCILILVFDAYKVKGGIGEVMDYHNIHVVYTKEAETADEYIEKVTHGIARQHRVTVATSDALEQLIIMGQGAARLSANDLKEEITRIANQIRSEHLDKQSNGRTYMREHFDDSILEFLFKEKGE